MSSDVVTDFEKNCKHVKIGLMASGIGLGLVIAGLVSNYWIEISGLGVHGGIFYTCHLFGCIFQGDTALGEQFDIWWILMVIGGIVACVCLALALAIRLYQMFNNSWKRSGLTIQTRATVIGSFLTIEVLGIYFRGIIDVLSIVTISWGLYVFAAGVLFNIVVVSVESCLQSKAFPVHQGRVIGPV